MPLSCKSEDSQAQISVHYQLEVSAGGRRSEISKTETEEKREADRFWICSEQKTNMGDKEEKRLNTAAVIVKKCSTELKELWLLCCKSVCDHKTAFSHLIISHCNVSLGPSHSCVKHPAAIWH